VVPSGVLSGKELRSAAQKDPIVAAHYADFRAESARIIRVAKEKQVFVSYRVGNRIYWTTKKLTLHAGETILTDGEHSVRTRCGNRISDAPVRPTSPVEPLAELSSAPFLPSRIDVSPEYLPFAPLSTDSPAAPFLVALNSASPPRSTGPGGGFYFFPPLFCCGTGNPNNPIPPPAVIPEPEPLVLLAIGLLSIGLLVRLRCR
jgi:hypothetical protein